MNETAVFSSGPELKAFVTSSANLLVRSWNAISSSYEEINSNEEVSWTVLEESGLNIIAFVTPPDYTEHPLQADLVSSSELREKNNFTHFEFLLTESNPLFSVNKAAVCFFQENYQKLDQLKSMINSSTPLIVTGRALGGSVASLFTLSLLDTNGSGKKRPLCITFGSPLIGDKNMQQAISRSSTWNSCFLHVVSHKDPLPGLFITSHSSSASQSRPQTRAYMPFGTFLFCSDVGSTCSEDPDSILELLVAMGSIHDQNEGLQSADYGSIVENLYSKAICKDLAAGAEHMTHSNSLKASISLQLLALGFAPHMQQQQHNIDINALAAKMEEGVKMSQKKYIFDPSKILNAVKTYMAQLEGYKKDSKNRGIGYYDSYKNMRLKTDSVALRARNSLTRYWKKMVEEAERKPQKEGKAFRKRWLFGGTNYRRMVEPLDIAQFYKDGGKNYVTENRSKHYKQLEEWLNKGTTATASGRQNVESILTMDSCFWAHVEEALISCEQLKAVEPNVSEKEQASKKLLEFEEYVYRLLKNYEVSPEIFLERSSYMRWWNEYKAIKGTSYNSTLAGFMSNPRNHEEYAVGAYDFHRGLINHLIRECGL